MKYSDLLSWKFYKYSIIIFSFLFGVSYITSITENRNMINKIVVQNENQQIIKLADIKYREEIINKYSDLNKIDTTGKLYLNIDSNQFQLFLKTFLITNLSESLKDTSFYIKGNLEILDKDIFKYDSVEVKLRANKDIFKQIITSAKTYDEAKTLILFGNYIYQESVYQKRLNTETLLILLLISLLFALLFLYILKNDIHANSLFRRVFKLRVPTNLESQTFDKIKEKFGEIVEKDINSAELVNIKVNDLQLFLSKFDSLEKENEKLISKDNRILITDLQDYSKRSELMYERSSIFLGFAFFISIFGIIIFYILLPQYRQDFKLNEYIGISIRPFLLLTFFQSLSFYLFKQYKSSITDYKYFYTEEKNKKRFLIAYQLLAMENEEKAKQIIGLEILRDKAIGIKDEDNSADELNRSTSIFDDYLKILEKLKGK